MTATELEEIRNAQVALSEFKRAMRAIQKINAVAGRPAAANAAMGIFGQAVVLHAEATKALIEHYPEQSGEVIALGGGDR